MSMNKIVTKDDIIKALREFNLQTLDDTRYEGAFSFAAKLLNISEDKLAEIFYDGDEERYG